MSEPETNLVQRITDGEHDTYKSLRDAARDNIRLDREMAYAHQHHTSYTCSDVLDAHTECKRARDHDGDHAAGFGSGRVRW